MAQILRLGTRASPLARWQADWVAARLRELGVQVEMVLITTQGDVKTAPLGQIGGMGLFTKELQRALLDGQIDLAVHSLKDLPTDVVPGLTLGAVPVRESIADVLVSRTVRSVEELPPNSRVGTGSLRRRAQLLHVRPDLVLLDIRGNVDTRLRKLDEGEFDAIVLAEAGLRRLGLEQRIAAVIPVTTMLPAVGQGALGIECRADDAAVLTALQPLNDPATFAAITAERTLLQTLLAGCLAPVGAWGRIEGELLRLEAVVISADGKRRIVAQGESTAENAMELGKAVAAQLEQQGAMEIIAAERQTRPA